jgi:hypothetical protein
MILLKFLDDPVEYGVGVTDQIFFSMALPSLSGPWLLI